MALYVVRDRETGGKVLMKVYTKLTDAEESKANYERYVRSMGCRVVEPFELAVFREHGIMKSNMPTN